MENRVLSPVLLPEEACKMNHYTGNQLFPFVCGLCNLAFRNLHCFYTHFHEHHELLGGTFYHLCQFDHLETRHDNDQETANSSLNILSCDDCSQTFGTVCAAHKHLVECHKTKMYLVDLERCIVFPKVQASRGNSVSHENHPIHDKLTDFQNRSVNIDECSEIEESRVLERPVNEAEGSEGGFEDHSFKGSERLGTGCSEKQNNKDDETQSTRKSSTQDGGNDESQKMEDSCTEIQTDKECQAASKNDNVACKLDTGDYIEVDGWTAQFYGIESEIEAGSIDELILSQEVDESGQQDLLQGEKSDTIHESGVSEDVDKASVCDEVTIHTILRDIEQSQSSDDESEMDVDTSSNDDPTYKPDSDDTDGSDHEFTGTLNNDYRKMTTLETTDKSTQYDRDLINSDDENAKMHDNSDSEKQDRIVSEKVVNAQTEKHDGRVLGKDYNGECEKDHNRVPERHIVECSEIDGSRVQERPLSEDAVGSEGSLEKGSERLVTGSSERQNDKDDKMQSTRKSSTQDDENDEIQKKDKNQPRHKNTNNVRL